MTYDAKTSDNGRTDVSRSYFEPSRREENPRLRERPFQREGYSRIDYRDVVSISRGVGEDGGYAIAEPFRGGYGHAEGGCALSCDPVIVLV
jgi:hypothetical protein